MEGEEPLPDDLRCKRSDGRYWRCKRRSVDGKSFCENHLYRPQKSSSLPKPKPRVRIRVVVKPEPVEQHPELASVPADNPVSVPGPATAPAPDHIRCNRNDGRSWRCKRQAVEGQCLCEVHLSKVHAQNQKRPRMQGQIPKDEKRKRNCSPSTVPENLRCGRTNGKDWRCKKQAMEGHTLCENHLNKLRNKEKQKPLSENEGSVPLPENLRCARNDGREWRCKRRVMEGQTLCETHFVKLKIRDSGSNADIEKPKASPKKKSRRESTPVPENLRCARTNGHEWQCKRRVFEGEKFCEFHLKKAMKIQNRKPKVGIKTDFESEPDAGKRKEKESPLPEVEGDDLRCKRTDGRGWRCKRRVLEGKTLCEIHYEQGRLRQMKVTVPESLKIKRGCDGGDKVEKRLKKKRALEALENNSDKGMKRMKAELIRVFLRREIIESSKKSEKANGNAGEVTRDLPYGLMAIPPAPPTQFLENAGSLGIKVGVNGLKSTVNRRFRSKNIEPPPISTLKVVPYVGNMGKVKSNGRRKCHWCRHADNRTLTKCLSCRKRFFCSDCIKERCSYPQEIEQRCPVCCGSCKCKACWTMRLKDVGTKEVLEGQCKGSKYQSLQYLINYLLPVLVRINQEQSIEVEMEAKLKGQNVSEVEIRLADVGCSDRCCCNNCKSPILDFHRSCPNCSYNLCLSCCREYSQCGSLGGVGTYTFQIHNRTKAHFGLKKCSEKLHKSSYDQSADSGDLAASDSLLDSTACLLSCPPMELGGCDNSLLDLRCIFPLNWTKELEISAKEMAAEHEFLQVIDNSMHCIFCDIISVEADKSKEIQEASRRKESEDNFLYCPSSSDDRDHLLVHFQKHWQKGQPVKVRNVLQGVSNLSWDPLAMFSSYLEKGSSNCENEKDAVEAVNYSDWYDVEIGKKDFFIGSTGDGYTHIQRETLKVKAKLSSALSRKLFEGRYREIIHALPLQEYTNPRSGLLNLAGKLPEDFPDYKLGPHVCISCGSREEVSRGELVTRLCYNSYDVVNILVHAGDVSCSTEQIDKIRKLIKQNNAKDKEVCMTQNLENEETRMHSGISVEAGERDRFLEGDPLSQGIAGASSNSAATNVASGVNLNDDKSRVKAHCSDTDSDASMICSGTSDSPEKSVDQMYRQDLISSSSLSHKRHLSEPYGAQWDVFRRQDIPKLLEYIAEHVDEFGYSYHLHKSVVHPIFDGSFYLDANHKMRLKEEFEIEPWTFNQCLGDAVFIPAGCPYQIRNIKSSVSITLGFVSPESASECIKLLDEIRVLPVNHRAKQDKLEVEKMAICSIDEAIKEMYRLKSEQRSQLDVREV